MSNTLEIVKVLVSPAEKLLDTISGAVGKWWEPTQIKRLADAKAHEIDTISEALRANSDIPIVYNKGEITADTTEFDSLVKRTQNRLAYQEICKQRNIENVANVAYSLLDGEEKVSSEPVSPEWIMRFLNSVEDISNEQMQVLWAKILAGEVKRPNSFSLRTLDVMKNLTVREAQLFSAIAPYVLNCFGDDAKSYLDYFIPTLASEEFDLKKYGLTFANLNALSDAGLLSSQTMLNVAITISPNEKEYIFSNHQAIEIVNNNAEKVKLTHLAMILSSSGIELLPIVLATSDHCPEDYLIDIIKSINSYPHLHRGNLNNVTFNLSDSY